MSDFDSYFTDPCELVAIVYASDHITELGSYSFRGYAKNMNRFFQICNLFTWEMSYLGQIKPDAKDITFKTFLNALRSSFYGYFKRGETKSLESVVKQHIDNLKQYKFKSRRLFFLLAHSDAESQDYREFDITIDRIFKWIIKMRQYRIEFYEHVLKEYKPRRYQYNKRLLECLTDERQNISKKLEEFSIDSVLAKLKYKSERQNNNVFPEIYYEIRNKSWYLKDLIKLENPEFERYTKRLPRYRMRSLHAHPEGLKAFFELFSIFKDEMSFILPDEPDKSFFERVLTVLKRDFINEFEKHGDLEDIIGDYIEELEKFEFLSLPKDQFFNKLSKTIYRLRDRRIAFYEALLEDYLANKEKYDKVL